MRVSWYRSSCSHSPGSEGHGYPAGFARVCTLGQAASRSFRRIPGRSVIHSTVILRESRIKVLDWVGLFCAFIATWLRDLLRIG